ncbi:dioxygenase [Acidaminococcus intestini]|nr:dioxygenase [Acidaminococcus intestini]
MGDPQTARRIHDLTGAVMTEDWGIDHGVWTLFVHMFPDASLPVVPLSVDGTLSPHDQYAFGEKLAALREEGIVVAGSGNIVHNLMQTDWNNPHGSKEADEFDAFITEKVQERDDEAVLAYRDHPLLPTRHPRRTIFAPSVSFRGIQRGNTGSL